ncbi:uncharacterized protein BXZ73DRAFT_99495 [Epithele typhae]|uniref:uncharacterized protein n=1 Tax=Epithele typhae TaxID=378194 RepID=UPI002008BA30|nr:uncharacterized protein BXZ73DRAFT_99495 [Epithele typhae]KAH9939293.1 hypothetical protein BXZ73DRAFT_99495 [Epithele typhae]
MSPGHTHPAFLSPMMDAMDGADESQAAPALMKTKLPKNQRSWRSSGTDKPADAYEFHLALAGAVIDGNGTDFKPGDEIFGCNPVPATIWSTWGALAEHTRGRRAGAIQLAKAWGARGTNYAKAPLHEQPAAAAKEETANMNA